MLDWPIFSVILSIYLFCEDLKDLQTKCASFVYYLNLYYMHKLSNLSKSECE